MKAGEFYAGGLDLQFFHSNDFEVMDEGNPSRHAAIIARNALRILMMGWREDWQKIISVKVLKAVFIQRDRELMRGMRLAFQEGFQSVYEQLKKHTPLTPEQHRQALLYISNCLTLLPFSDINPYESIAVPQWVNGEWRLVDYKVVPIELTPTNGLKKLFINDKDRVFAYGLEPITDDKAEPHLLFMGTTYPAGQGFVTQINTDLEGFETVGNKLYQSGRQRLFHWLDKQTKKVHVCGTSLGGSLSLLLAIDRGDKLSRVDALNPAGLYDFWFKDHFDNWEKLNIKPQVIIQKQGNDPVSQFGVWKEDWDVVHVIPPRHKQGPNQFIDHALNYAGFAETQFIGVDTVMDNEEHRQRNFWLYTLGRGLVYYLGLVPYHYFIRPCLHYVATHKTQMTLTCAFIVLFSLLPMFIPLVITPALSLAAIILNAVISGVVTSFLIDRTLWFLIDYYKGDNSSEVSKLLNWLRTQSLSPATMIGIGTVGVGAVVTLLLVGTILMPALLFTVASLTTAIYATYKSNEAFNIVFGSEKIPPAACHEPRVPKNASLDIYANEKEEVFSLKELGEYYYAKRVVLKDKSFIPENDKGRTRFGGRSKKELLMGLETEPPNTLITVTATKAKFYEIKHTVRLINQIGLHSSKDKQKEFLQENLADYYREKHAFRKS
ncbi:hypothetical protein [Legionella brunensis]|uniref:Uncharacterized protein n=1 Tax=Legionella brunensis TaxID=29422 RepID=A0A0W0S4I0_9GAMM|nr:hypothetical protein [Legionella brunensis]KTC78004.1 hypothetical protein Lbru_2296 [Legionella brunensis]